MTKLKLKAKKITPMRESADLMHAGDLCIRELPMYNSEQVILAVVLKCPFCGLDMASTSIHKIKIKNTWLDRFLHNTFGAPLNLTITPKLACPYNSQHVFLISRGRIKISK